MATVPARLTVRVLAVLLATAIVGASALGCRAHPDPASPASTDDAPPQRIVSIIPATTEILFAIGAGDRVVGIGSYDRYPPEANAIPRVGGLMDPNTERILTLRPDLVVLYATQVELQQQLARAGIPYYPYEHQALPDVMDTVRRLGERVGAAEAAGALAEQMRRELDAVRASVAGRRRPSVLLVFGRDPGGLRNVYASGGYGFLADILDIAGGENIFGTINQQSVQVGTEQLLTLAPEVIIELQYEGTDSNLDARRADDWRALPSVPAVRNGRVYLLRGDEFVVPGPRVVQAAQRMASTLASVPQ